MRRTCTWADTAAIPGIGISVLDGIRAKVGDKAKVLYEKGCKITTAPEGFRGWWANDVELVDPKTQAASIQAAADAARKSDVAIVVVGENESTNREAWAEKPPRRSRFARSSRRAERPGESSCRDRQAGGGAADQRASAVGKLHRRKSARDP